MGPGLGQYFVAPGQPSLVWVWLWKISPKNPNSGQKNLFGSGQKVPGSKMGWPLI